MQRAEKGPQHPFLSAAELFFAEAALGSPCCLESCGQPEAAPAEGHRTIFLSLLPWMWPSLMTFHCSVSHSEFESNLVQWPSKAGVPSPGPRTGTGWWLVRNWVAGE